jgi:heparan-alpha-glucosaminide N-acetyltransferase
MTSQSRIGAIDILKGAVIVSILFLNVFCLNSQPLWPGGQGTPEVAGIAAGIIYPALIFLIGMTIPYSITKKINEGLTGNEIIRHLFARSLILITVGVLMVNTSRVEPELTGISKNIWSVLLFAAIFLVWNRYPEKDNNFFTISGLRLLGLASLIFLIFRFRSGTLENNGSIITGSWELPGLAGWGYIVAGLTYLAFRNSLSGTFTVWAFFLAINILSQLNLTSFLDPVRPYFGVLLNGYLPVIILTGQLAGILLKKYPHNEFRKPVIVILISGVVLTAAGILLKRYYFTDGIFGNPSWALISCGITALIFITLFWLDEGMKLLNPAILIKPAGENMFTIYILQFLLLNVAWLTGTDVFFFLKPGAVILNIAGSAVWTLLVLGTASLLIRFNIRLKF